MLEILVVCPGHVATGGTEALHLFCSELNKVDDVHAQIFYWNIRGSADPAPKEFDEYGCEYVTDPPDGFDGAIVLPEIWANKAVEFSCKKAIYWLGIDAYGAWTPEEERGAFLSDDSIVHIAQSEYAWDFLYNLGIKRLVRCSDIVNRAFYEEYQEEPRSNTILYNPAKSSAFMSELMAKSPEFEFKPITGMTRAEVIDTMRHAKLYMDFGEFPGRERIPREAVLCGCCLITSRIGSAAFMPDFCHTYKFESKSSHIWAIKRKMQHVLDSYEECRKDFNAFRLVLKGETEAMNDRIRRVAYEIQYCDTGT